LDGQCSVVPGRGFSSSQLCAQTHKQQHSSNSNNRPTPTESWWGKPRLLPMHACSALSGPAAGCICSVRQDMRSWP
jgi:hypothetical protein